MRDKRAPFLMTLDDHLKNDELREGIALADRYEAGDQLTDSELARLRVLTQTNETLRKRLNRRRKNNERHEATRL